MAADRARDGGAGVVVASQGRQRGVALGRDGGVAEGAEAQRPGAGVDLDALGRAELVEARGRLGGAHDGRLGGVVDALQLALEGLAEGAVGARRRRGRGAVGEEVHVGAAVEGADMADDGVGARGRRLAGGDARPLSGLGRGCWRGNR